MRKSPEEPSKKEVDEHYIDHGLFRSWCPHCVRGKAAAYGHRRMSKESRSVPVVGLDYMFMTDRQRKEEESGSPILVIKDEKLKMVFAHVVPSKGRDKYAIERMSKGLDMLGHKKVILKSDGENAIQSLKSSVKDESGLDIVMEGSPVGEHQ